tara:strand:- start:1652 stop:1939 length:288 start_codon:yes stop_codon:yes gene_type:complete
MTFDEFTATRKLVTIAENKMAADMYAEDIGLGFEHGPIMCFCYLGTETADDANDGLCIAVHRDFYSLTLANDELFKELTPEGLESLERELFDWIN